MNKKVEDYVRSIPDFPEPGIIFRDVTSVITIKVCRKHCVNQAAECFLSANP